MTIIEQVRHQHNSLNYAGDVFHNLNVLKTGKGDLRVPLIDIYVNQACNLRCSFCINGTNFYNSNLSIDSVDVIRKLNPRLITLTGGGEPTIYKWNGHGLGSYIEKIRNVIGPIPIGMMTNGVVLASDYVQSELDWIRVSLNSANRESYKIVHKADKFTQVISNIINYLNGPIKRVGVGFVYTTETSMDIVKFSKLIFENIYTVMSVEKREKLTVQFRPVADQSYTRLFISSSVTKELFNQIGDNIEFREFLIKHTNLFDAISNKVFDHNNSFTNCFFSLLQMNINSNGDVYPCPQMAHNFKDSYGNLFSEDFLEELKQQVISSYHGHTSDSCSTCSQNIINHLYGNVNTKDAKNKDTTIFF